MTIPNTFSHYCIPCTFFRRIADVRSVGYTECFMLLREDVLAATRDYPEAQVNSDQI